MANSTNQLGFLANRPLIIALLYIAGLITFWMFSFAFLCVTILALSLFLSLTNHLEAALIWLIMIPAFGVMLLAGVRICFSLVHAAKEEAVPRPTTLFI